MCLIDACVSLQVRIWQPSTGNVSVALLKGHRKGITALVRAFICFCLSVAALSTHIETQAWEPAHLMLPSRHVASSSRDNTVRVWDITTRCVSERPPSQTPPPHR